MTGGFNSNKYNRNCDLRIHVRNSKAFFEVIYYVQKIKYVKFIINLF